MYDYKCSDCGKESLVVLTLKEHELGEVSCPGCGSKRMKQLYTPFIAHTAKKSQESFMRPFHHDVLSTIVPIIVVIGLTAMTCSSFLHAQDFPSDMARGKAVYERHCQRCHGPGGWGDGPEAAELKVRPANFHAFRSFLKSDEELLRTIEHGVVFSPMHSWRGQLSDGEMQDVVAYIRLLSQQGR